jgi:hypothetical protein
MHQKVEVFKNKSLIYHDKTATLETSFFELTTYLDASASALPGGEYIPTRTIASIFFRH